MLLQLSDITGSAFHYINCSLLVEWINLKLNMTTVPFSSYTKLGSKTNEFPYDIKEKSDKQLIYFF